jgi:hypothetical protein
MACIPAALVFDVGNGARTAPIDGIRQRSIGGRTHHPGRGRSHPTPAGGTTASRARGHVVAEVFGAEFVTGQVGELVERERVRRVRVGIVGGNHFCVGLQMNAGRRRDIPSNKNQTARHIRAIVMFEKGRP